ncbi:MAG: ribonuclease R [Chitinophagaceae bacterium]
MGRKNFKKKKKERQKKATNNHLLKGVLDITRSGMGFVMIENEPVDVLVKREDFNTALHGDTVRVKITKAREGSRMQGEVTEVVQRRQTEFIGQLEITEEAGGRGYGFFVPESDKPMPDFYVPAKNFNGAKNKDRVVVRLVEWESGKKPLGEVVTVMDKEDENDAAMKEILLENGFPLQFDDDVMEEADRIPDRIPSSEIKKRKDIRNILTFTIDPVDAKDFDDAISFRVLKNGNYEVGVHIADVSYYVEEGTALDKEAYRRATSVYLPDRVNPMLPEHISNVLCSLRPKEDKLTFSAIFEITPKAQVKKYWLGRTLIHSDHRFTYEEVQEIIETSQGPYADEILILNNIAQRLRKKRFDKGAINFSSQEVRFKLDENKKPIGILIKESKEAHQLIEELMLLANRTVASDLIKVKINNKSIPFPFRVHDNPDEEKLIPFIAFARKFGHRFDTSTPEAIAVSFNQMLQDVAGKPEQHVLEQLGIRTMAKAKYSTENIGHYGLGFENYCHFTSPIRRYPDVMVHRVLGQVIEKNVRIDKKMEEKCKHCSERERAAMEAERTANKYKQVEYMKEFLGEEFDGVISGVASFGFWVETVEHKCEGLVSLNSLLDFDNFRLVESEYCLVGKRSGKKFRMGDKVRIKVVAANLQKRQLDYEWVIATAIKEDGQGRKKRKPKK